MKIKHNLYFAYEMERYPKNCKECPCFSTHPYTCHNERGTEAFCSLGYMDESDTRDFKGDSKFHKCKIETNCAVSLMKGGEG